MDYIAIANAALEKRASLIAELRSVNDDTVLSDAEKRERIERVETAVAEAEAEARTAVDNAERDAAFRGLSDKVASLAVGRGTSGPTGEKRERDLDAEFRAVALGEQREVEITADGGIEKRIALLSSTPNAGTTVDNTFVTMLIDSLREQSPILQAGVQVLTTATGEKMEMPVKTGRLLGNRLGENTPYTRTDMAFTRIDLSAFKYGVSSEASVEMLNDSALPLASLIASDMGETLADLTNLDFLRGTGTNQPKGLLTGATLGTTGATIATTLTFDNLINLQHAVVPRYRPNAKFYTSDSAVLALRKIKDNDGRYIWQDPTVAGQQGASLLGRQVLIDVNMPAANAASSKIVAFGDFQRFFVVRFVRNVVVSRSDEIGWDRDVVAWKANVRCDSEVKDTAALATLNTPAT